MEMGAWMMVGLLGLSFIYGIWLLLIRGDAPRSQRKDTNDYSRFRRRRSGPSFGEVRTEIEQRLAVIAGRNRAREEAERAITDAENARLARIEAEAAAVKAEEERLLREEQAARQAEIDAQKAAEEAEERRKFAEEEEERRRQEEERLAAEAVALRLAAEEAERQRQIDLAAAEEQRLAEIEAAEEAARLAAMVDAQEVEEETARELRERLEAAGGRIGDINISLMWNNYNDLDLHVVAPSGERLHGGNRTSQCSGELDVDANVKPETKRPVENVVWDIGEAPNGMFRVYVHHYKKHKKRGTKDPTEFKIIVNAGGVFTEYNSEISSGDPIMLITEFEMKERSPEEEAARRAALAAEKEEEEARLAAIAAEEEEARLAAEAAEATRLAELAAQEEEARLAAEAAEAERLAAEAAQEEKDRLAAEAAAEEAERQRLADLAAAEEQRLADLAAAEEQRLAEIAAAEAAAHDAEERSRIQAEEVAAETQRELRKRLEEAGGRIGDVNVSLMWNNYNDLDLHVVAPSGERLHGGNKNSACGGELDVDANVQPDTKRPVENVVWDFGEAPNGTYNIYVHHYKKHKKRRTKDPTLFKIIVGVNEKFNEFNSEISSGDPIMFITDFTVGGPTGKPPKPSKPPADSPPGEDPLAAFMDDEDEEGEPDHTISL